MANYDVSIKIAIAGAKELDRVNKQTEKLRSSINAVNKTAELSGKKPIRNFNNLSKSVQNARDALDEAATGTKEFNQAVKNLVQVENKFDRQLKQRERRLKIQRLAQKEGISFSKAKILLAKKEAEAEAKLAASKEKTANAEKRRQSGRTISSALIGGAFPLLFGQGLGASIGGAAGGFAGGRMKGKGSEQMGFALSLVGTTLGSQLDRLAKSATELGTALRNPIKNVDLLVKKIGQVNTPFGDTVETLKSLGLEAVAADQVLDNFNKTFGTNKTKLSQLGEESVRFTNELQKLGTGITLFVAGPLAFFLEKINAALGFQTVDEIRDLSRAEAIKEKRIELGILKPDGSRGPLFAFKQLFEGKIRNMPDVQARAFELFEQNMNKAGLGGEAGTRDFSNENLQRIIKERRDFELSSLNKQLEIEQKSFGFRSEDIKVLKRRMDLLKIVEKIKVKELVNTEIMTDEQKRAHEFALDKLDIERQISEELLKQAIIMSDPMNAAIVDLNKEFTKLMDLRFQAVEFAQIFGQSFENSFKGIIKGTMTVQDAFRNMFNRIADHFLDMAAQMLANRLSRSLLGFIGNAFLGGMAGQGGGINLDEMSLYSNTGGPTMADFGGNFANGGRPPVGRASIVGERGPELFVPDRAGTIIPNHGMGGMNIVVNVDASGSNVEGDEDEGRALGIALSAAIETELIKQKRPGGLLA